MASTYQPLYKPRAKRHIGASQSLPATQARIPLPSSSLSSSLSASDKFTITLHAALSRQPRDGPLPFSLPHIELHLAWPEPERFKWVPGRKWVPSWRLSYVEGEDGVIVVRTNQDEKRGMVRGLAKGVVGSLPVVWRFAGWL
jgi:hypothetical protein